MAAAARLVSKRGPSLWTAARAMATQPSTAPADNIVLMPAPEAMSEEVLRLATAVFVRDEPLSQSFAPCPDGRREAAFRQFAAAQLRHGLSVVARDGPGGPLVGCCLNSPLRRADKAACPPDDEDADVDADPLVPNVERLLTAVHRQLDVFSKMAVDSVFELGVAAVDPAHTGKGIGTRLLRFSLQRAALLGFPLAKVDCTGPASARAALRAGMVTAAELPYALYRPPVFRPRGQLTVLLARLSPRPPYVLPADVSAFRGHRWHF